MDSRLLIRLQVTSPLCRLFEAADAAGFQSLEMAFVSFWERIQNDARAFVQLERLITG